MNTDTTRKKSIMGIDLGTTNSCVAIPCDGEGRGSVVVVTDSFDRATIPSVVYKDVSGKFLVGHSAKQKMGTSPPPIAFIKRYMGKDHRVSLRDETLSPEQISSMILKHLKELVQQKHGMDINQAVITIPARFDLAGQQATVEAARLAGLDVLTTMPEPVAAALAYGLEDDADDLKIFCYDLGGGTFDATVMTKNAETGIEVNAFDGDEHLGGFNFDTEFAKWILERLQAKGYSLDLDWESAADLVIFQKLMRIAEKAKIALSEYPEYTISEKEVFDDHDGNTVDIEMAVTRREYEQLIMPLLERTIEISLRAIAKAKLTPDRIDRVIMVGGSSRLPILHEMLHKSLGKKPQLVDPDKIVARGAAVKAGAMVGGPAPGFEFAIPIPTHCSLDSFDVAGRVTLPQPENLRVTIEREDGGYRASAVTDAGGNFGFTEVELIENEENDFEIVVGTAQAPLLRHAFRVRQDATAVAVDIGTSFITAEVGLLLSDGREPIFREGEKIPRETMTTISTVYDGQTYAKFDVYNGSHILGDVTLANVPPGLPKESAIHVNVRIDESLAISGRATLVKTGQSVDFTFRIPRPKLPGIEEMRRRFDALLSDFSDAVEHIPDNALRLRQYSDGQRHIRELRKTLDAQPCDIPHASRLLDEFALLISNVSHIDVMQPAWEVFAGKLADARLRAKSAEARLEKARRANFSAILDSLDAFATQAFKDRNKEVWQQANAQLDRVLEEIDFIVHEEERTEILRSMTPQEKAEGFRRMLAERLREAQERFTSNPMFAAHEGELRGLIREVNALNPMSPESVFDAIQGINTRIDELMVKLEFDDGKTKRRRF